MARKGKGGSKILEINIWQFVKKSITSCDRHKRIFLLWTEAQHCDKYRDQLLALIFCLKGEELQMRKNT